MGDDREPSGYTPVATRKRAEPGALTDECADIRDPLKRAMCRVCQKPVVGDVHFCKDHQPEEP